MASLTIFASLFCLLYGQEPAENKYHVLNNRILDNTNRECFFHGVNVVYKSPPYLPIMDHFDANLSFSKEDMELLNELGQNVIRLGVMWPGVAPERDSFNETYITQAANLIQDAYNNYNISSLVDCHQDVLSEAVCGEGAPLWATQPLDWNFPLPLAAPYATNNHIPTREECLSITWSTYYVAEATCSAFQRLYQNYDGLTEKFADYWGKLASSFKSIPGIVGFELLNEPWAGGIYEDPLLALPGEADRKNLAPFYDAVVPSIYGNDSDRLVFFESVTWTDEFNISATETGFERVPGGSQYANQSVFSFHYYTPPNDGPEDDYFYERTRDAVRWNATSFLTEFDISNDDESDKGFETMSTTMDYCDEFLISWIGWEYKPLAGALDDGTCTGCGYGAFLKNGTANDKVRKALSRTYAQKVAGKTRMMKFDWKNNPGNFTLIYDMDKSIKEPTIIYTNKKYWYPNGYKLNISPQNTYDVRTNGNYIEVYNGNYTQTVTINIIPSS